MFNYKNLVLLLVLFSMKAFSYVEGISVDQVSVYKNKQSIPVEIIGERGFAIPEDTPLVIMNTNNATYAHWTFVVYGDVMDQTLSLWLTAKATGKTISCVNKDKGNYWVECVGSWIN